MAARPLFLGSLVGLLLLTGSVIARAAQSAQDGARGGPSEDLALATSCQGCHTQSTVSGSSLPRLADRSAAALEDILLAYREGALSGTLMNRIARGYTPDELARISRVLGREPAR